MSETIADSRAWIGIGLDPINQRVTILCFANTPEEVRAACESRRGEFDTTTVLEFTDPQFGEQLYGFLRRCNIVHGEATSIIRQIGMELLPLFDDETEEQ